MDKELQVIADEIIDDNFEVLCAFDVVDGHIDMKKYFELCKAYRQSNSNGEKA